MFKKEKKVEIWQIVNDTNLGIIKKGRCLNILQEEVKIPSLEEITITSMNHLRQTGMFIQRENSLKTSNCILRVYSCTNLQKGQYQYWTYGSTVFFKKLFRYKNSYNIPFNPDLHNVDYLLNGSFYLTKPFFKDIYLYLS